MPYLTLTENLKPQLSTKLDVSYDILPGNRVGLFWDTHTFPYLLALGHTGLKFHIFQFSVNCLSRICHDYAIINQSIANLYNSK